MFFRRYVAIASVSGFSCFALVEAPAMAQDAEWGCQVLLCAASSNPSWHGVPYCVPPMTKLIAAMKLPGFSWPICPGSNTGKPGKEIYEDCPEGWTPASSQSIGESSMRSGPASKCEKVLTNAELRALKLRRGQSLHNDTLTFGDGSAITVRYESTGNRSRAIGVQKRRTRADPYYLDIPNAQGISQRFWFNLDY